MSSRPIYKPYESDTTDTDSTDTDTTDSSSTDSTSSTDAPSSVPDFSALARGLDGFTEPFEDVSGATGATGPTGPTGNDSQAPLGNEIVPPGPLITFKNYEFTPDASGVKIESNTQSITNVIMIDSRDRDRQVYPQPTNLTLRLPRIYKQVTAFQLVQIKLLSAFYYFSGTKNNTTISILELGRKVSNGITDISDIIVNTIREGTYDINSLITEITTQLNYTPLFYDFINGFSDFAVKFSVTGDFFLNFNYPGDTYYDSILDEYIPNPTIDLIVSKYFVNRYANLSYYTIDQMRVAYYYPVLKEILLDTTYVPPYGQLNLTLVTSAADLLEGESPRSRVIYTFQGINDPVILELINLNVDTLTDYRLKHTFRYFLINKYNVSYETYSNRVVFACPSLNTSLVNLLTYKQNQYFAEQLSANALTQADYDNLSFTNATLLATLNDMVNTYKRALAVYFGIPFDTYTTDYLLNSSYHISIRDGLNAIGISSNFSGTTSGSNIGIRTDIVSPFLQAPAYYWNQMKNLPDGTSAYMNPIIPGETSDKGLNYNTWNNDMDTQDALHPIILSNVLDSNNPNTTTIGNLYINTRTQYADVIVPIEAAKYTTFRFKSPVRQTLRVETLPRPTKYRYPAYNAVAYDISHQQLFDNSYCFVENTANQSMDISSILIRAIPGFTTSNQTANFGISFSTSQSYWGGSNITLSVLEPRAFYDFYTPYPPTTGAPAYTYPLRLTLSYSSNPVTPLQLFVYQDRAAFMADISGNRQEKPIHYIQTLSTISTSASVDFLAYANKRYYVLARPQNTSFATENFRIIPSFPSTTFFTSLTTNLTGFDPLADPTSNLTNYNYAQVADPAFIKLPTTSTLYRPPALDSSFSALTFSTSIMGYDTNGVTTDLTNYIGFLSNVAGSNSVPNSVIRIDPTNGFLFQAKSPYNSTTGVYMTGSNTILYPYGAGVYTPATQPYRQQSIVHWYGNTFIPPSQNQLLYDSGSLSALQPFYASYPPPTYIGGYDYQTRMDISGDVYLGTPSLLNLGDGVMGIGFLPSQGVWDIDAFMFKSAFTNSNNDPNLEIRYIGIFPAARVTSKEIQSLELTGAQAVLSFASSITYNSSNLNFGFDVGGGTYYNFTRSSAYLTGSNSYAYGYSQSQNEYNFDINAYYVAVPFTASSNVCYYNALVGSVVPYPLYSGLEIVNSAPSPIGPLIPPTATQFILPNGTIAVSSSTFGPPPGYNASQSQYEQSMPIGTNVLLYATPYPINTITNPFKPWTPLAYTPTEIIADCSGFLLTKNTDYQVLSYPIDNQSTIFHTTRSFTLDEVFPSSSNINYLGVTANESVFAFFGLSNASPQPYLFIRTLDPATGYIETAYSEPSPLNFQSNTALVDVLYNNYGGYVLSAQTYNSTTLLTDINVVAKANQATSTFTSFECQVTNSTIDRFLIGQSPKEAFGRFWVFPHRTTIGGIQDFVEVNPNDSNDTAPPGIFKATMTSGKYATIYPYYVPGDVYTSPIVTRDVAKDRLFFLSLGQPTKFFEPNILAYTSTPTMVTSYYNFPAAPNALYSGANGAKWAQINSTMYGNRQDSVDAPKMAAQAWQVFYPVQRIVFHQIAKNFSFLLDLSGRQYPEYPHTAISLYDSSGAFTNDTSGKWGLESPSNFLTADYSFSGYYFNAYDYIAPLHDNRASNDFYYMNLRNYSPTEKSQVTLRISAPNKYTFGYVTPIDISGEISTALYVNSSRNPLYTYYWDDTYIRSITAFNSNFIIDSNGKTFGAGVIEGYAGSNISSVTGFGDFYGRMIALYSTYSVKSILASTINMQVKVDVANFVQTDMKYIIPTSALNRQRFTDPLRFSILWKSALKPPYTTLEETWGLGWNLGYTKMDTPYETIQRGASFFKIIDDYIGLRMSPEFDMNRVDTGSKENLAATHEPTGYTKAFYGKLLLANFGNYAQTLISNPIAYLNPIGKLDRLTFQWIDNTGAILNNNDCEWNAVIQITESIEIATTKKGALFNPVP